MGWFIFALIAGGYLTVYGAFAGALRGEKLPNILFYIGVIAVAGGAVLLITNLK
jgi:hypothetical protein